jgi:hypothetical protein
MMAYKRIRFVSTADDYRPVKWPISFPYWCSGYDANDNAILIVYLPDGERITDYWPEAEQLDIMQEVSEITYSGRFPKPDWM